MSTSEQFEAVVSEQYDGLFRFAISLTRSQSDAEDLTQQTFYTWALKGHQLRNRSSVKAWLFTTMHRTFLAARRKQCRFSHHHWEEVVEELPLVESPEVTSRVDVSEVLAALAKVDEVYHGAVALFYLEDLTYDEIASVLEIPVGTVKSRLSRGLRQLRRILTQADLSLATMTPIGGRVRLHSRELDSDLHSIGDRESVPSLGGC